MKKLLEPNEYSVFATPRDTEKSLNVLTGILTGIAIDKLINSNEISELKHWCENNACLNKKEPYKSIIETVLTAIEDEIITQDEIDDITWQCERVNTHLYDEVTECLQTLSGIFHGVLADKVITDNELYQLQDWINENDHLKSTYPYDEIEVILHCILKDGKVTDEERCTITGYIGQFVDTSLSLNINKSYINKLTTDYSVSGICMLQPNVIFKNKLFCFTGSSIKAKRKDFAEIVQRLGGIFTNEISKNTDYLIVGDNGSPSWAYSCHGRKIETVMLNRTVGAKTVIVHELDFWDAVADFE